MAADWLLVWVLAVIFVATLIRSAFGFGEALVAVPLLALIMPVEVAAPASCALPRAHPFGSGDAGGGYSVPCPSGGGVRVGVGQQDSGGLARGPSAVLPGGAERRRLYGAGAGSAVDDDHDSDTGEGHRRPTEAPLGSLTYRRAAQAHHCRGGAGRPATLDVDTPQGAGHSRRCGDRRPGPRGAAFPLSSASAAPLEARAQSA